jgi:hypothetical protein
VGTREYKKLLSLSTSGKNEAVQGLPRLLLEKVLVGIKDLAEDNRLRNSRVWSLSNGDFSRQEIGESILTALADDIRVSVTADKVEFIVIKSKQK